MPIHPNAIDDRFTRKRGKGNKVLSRQRRYQLRRQAKGRCIVCSKKAVPGYVRCEKHRQEDLARYKRVIRRRKTPILVEE